MGALAGDDSTSYPERGFIPAPAGHATVRLRRTAALALLAVLALVPGTSSGGQVSFETAAPVTLYGDVTLGSDGLIAHHHAWADNTLAGVAFRARLIEHRSDDFGPVQSRVLAESNRTARADFALLEGSMASLAFDRPFRFRFTPAESQTSAPPQGPPVAHLGTNPNLLAPSADREPDPWQEMQILPAAHYLVVPERGFNTTGPFRLTLDHGNLSWSQQGQDPRTERAGAWREVVQVQDPLGILPPQSEEHHVLRTLELDAQVVVYALGQQDLQAVMDHWTDADAVEAGGSGAPLGWWPRDKAHEFAAARAERSLPATVFSAQNLSLSVHGVLALRDAYGTLVDTENGSVVLEAFGDDVDLGGRLEARGTSAQADERRLNLDVNGTIDSMRTTPEPMIPAWAAPLGYTGAGLAVVAAGVWLWPVAKWGAARALIGPLYARIHRDEVLEHPLRDDILTTVRAEPGISASELGRRTECGWGTLVYHLSVLEREHLISSAREGRHRRFFSQDRINYSDKPALALLRNDAARRLVLAVQEKPGIIQKQLSRRLGLSPSTIAWHVGRLERAGLLVKEADGRRVRYFPSSRLDTLSPRPST
jgi:DNA-binding transcriptional ArsR family regulator